MKQEEFQRKDGTKGTKNIIEPGDKFKSRFDSPRKNNAGKYENYSLGITTMEGEDTFVQLTKGQAKRLQGLGNVQGKTIEAYEYENEYGKNVGLRLAKE